jgi:hypothetical protein
MLVLQQKHEEKNYWRIVSGQHCLLAEGDIGAPIYWHSDAPHAITIGGPMVLLLIWLVRIKEKKKRRTKQFGAPHLFSSQSPINSALQTGNGNTLKITRRPH